jgi:hypothetical protein
MAGLSKKRKHSDTDSPPPTLATSTTLASPSEPAQATTSPTSRSLTIAYQLLHVLCRDLCPPSRWKRLDSSTWSSSTRHKLSDAYNWYWFPSIDRRLNGLPMATCNIHIGPYQLTQPKSRYSITLFLHILQQLQYYGHRSLDLATVWTDDLSQPNRVWLELSMGSPGESSMGQELATTLQRVAHDSIMIDSAPRSASSSSSSSSSSATTAQYSLRQLTPTTVDVGTLLKRLRGSNTSGNPKHKHRSIIPEHRLSPHQLREILVYLIMMSHLHPHPIPLTDLVLATHEDESLLLHPNASALDQLPSENQWGSFCRLDESKETSDYLNTHHLACCDAGMQTASQLFPESKCTIQWRTSTMVFGTKTTATATTSMSPIPTRLWSYSMLGWIQMVRAIRRACETILARHAHASSSMMAMAMASHSHERPWPPPELVHAAKDSKSSLFSGEDFQEPWSTLQELPTSDKARREVQLQWFTITCLLKRPTYAAELMSGLEGWTSPNPSTDIDPGYARPPRPSAATMGSVNTTRVGTATAALPISTVTAAASASAPIAAATTAGRAPLSTTAPVGPVAAAAVPPATTFMDLVMAPDPSPIVSIAESLSSSSVSSSTLS